MAAVETLVNPVAPPPPVAAQSRIDARPALPVSAASTSLWDRAADRRDAIANRITARFDARGITAWVRKSKPGEYPLLVAVDSWLPVGETDVAATVDRSSLVITISVAPYLECPLIYRVELRRHAKHLTSEYWSLGDADIDQLVAYLLDGGERPPFFAPRVPLAMRILGAFVPFVGNEPKNELIQDARSHFWTVPTAIYLFALVAAGLLAFDAWDSAGYDAAPIGTYALAMLIAAVGIGIATVLVRRRPVLQAIPKQSLRCPRREFRVDSWHVSVPGAGSQFEAFKQRIYRATASNDTSIESNLEVHQNVTPRGFEERERLVLAKGQATLHVHVYPFADDVFVGWDSHLNWHRWAEGDTISSTVQGKCSVEYKGLQVGVHVPTEFDLIECDVLTETAHRRIVEEIKAFLKEREIEADLDFKIIRGDRTHALEAGKDDKRTARSTPRLKAT